MNCTQQEPNPSLQQITAKAPTVATAWLPVAHQLLRAAGFEATMTDTAALLELAGRVLLGVGSAAARAARQYPLLALALLAGAAWLAWRGGYLRRDQWKATGRQALTTRSRAERGYAQSQAIGLEIMYPEQAGRMRQARAGLRRPTAAAFGLTPAARSSR